MRLVIPTKVGIQVLLVQQPTALFVLKPEIFKVFPTSEAVNNALANMLAFSEATQSLLEVKSAKGARRKAA